MNDTATSPASAVTPNSYTVEDADFALGIPTRNGATFLGWYDNAALSGAAITTLHTAEAAAAAAAAAAVAAAATADVAERSHRTMSRPEYRPNAAEQHAAEHDPEYG